MSLDDHDRPLNLRGEAGAERMGTWLADREHIPKTILCSTATRAKMTAQIIMEQFADKPDIDYIAGLYHASPDTILAKVRLAPPGDLMIVGHNPGMASFADLICQTRPKHERFTVYPTTATLVAEVPISAWSELKFGSARELSFVVPRELKAMA